MDYFEKLKKIVFFLCHPLPVGVSPERSWEAKLPRDVNGDGRYGHGVGALSEYDTLNSRSAENGATCGSPAVGGLKLPCGVLTGRDILSQPAWQARRVNGFPDGDSAKKLEPQEVRLQMPAGKK